MADSDLFSTNRTKATKFLVGSKPCEQGEGISHGFSKNSLKEPVKQTEQKTQKTHQKTNKQTKENRKIKTTNQNKENKVKPLQRVAAQQARNVLKVFTGSSEGLKVLFKIFISEVKNCACINITDAHLEGWKEGEEL